MLAKCEVVKVELNKQSFLSKLVLQEAGFSSSSSIASAQIHSFSQNQTQQKKTEEKRRAKVRER